MARLGLQPKAARCEAKGKKTEAPVTSASRPRGGRPTAVADHARAREGEHRVRKKKANVFML
jgi:hypothetical protein